MNSHLLISNWNKVMFFYFVIHSFSATNILLRIIWHLNLYRKRVDHCFVNSFVFLHISNIDSYFIWWIDGTTLSDNDPLFNIYIYLLGTPATMSNKRFNRTLFIRYAWLSIYRLLRLAAQRLNFIFHSNSKIFFCFFFFIRSTRLFIFESSLQSFWQTMFVCDSMALVCVSYVSERE